MFLRSPCVILVTFPEVRYLKQMHFEIHYVTETLAIGYNYTNKFSVESMSPSELKKWKNKQRKQQKKMEKEKEKQKQEQEKKDHTNKKAQEQDQDGPKEEELVPDKLARVS